MSDVDSDNLSISELSPSVTVEELVIEKQSIIQKYAAWIVAAILLVAFAIYAMNFPIPFSGSQEVWGQFGDFVGGLINPIIGLFTVILLTASLRQNHWALAQANKALIQANVALAQSQRELHLTRTAINQASEMQAATEAALKEQIEIAKHARDMNNAVALLPECERQRQNVKKEIADENTKVWSGEPDTREMERKLRIIEEMQVGLTAILGAEVTRLLKKYPQHDDPSKPFVQPLDQS